MFATFFQNLAIMSLNTSFTLVCQKAAILRYLGEENLTEKDMKDILQIMLGYSAAELKTKGKESLKHLIAETKIFMDVLSVVDVTILKDMDIADAVVIMDCFTSILTQCSALPTKVNSKPSWTGGRGSTPRVKFDAMIGMISKEKKEIGKYKLKVGVKMLKDLKTSTEKEAML